MGRINVLSKELSELIAAGEVIDRPSSVIKELLENSIDSGADVITVEIKNGGRTYMRITDNGCGIAFEDISTAFLRHATSKISQRDDLDKIMTLGFRGEALASVSAVAKVDVLTKRTEDELGTHYRICGCDEEIKEQSGCPDGTTIIVRDIFYNVPARLKFLKKDTAEANSVAAIVSKIALSHPEISIKFIRENKTELLTAGDGKLYSAIYSVFGREFASSLIPVDYSYNGVEVTGFTVKPLFAKANHMFQNFFINNRYVKSLTCMHAVDEAYTNNIMTGKVPACVINVRIQPNIVDVNVHPTKIEVRFSNEKLIYDSVYFAIKNALLVSDKPSEPKIDDVVQKNFTTQQLYQPFHDEKATQLKFDISEDKPEKAITHLIEPSIAVAQKAIYESVVRADECINQTVQIIEPEVKPQIEKINEIKFDETSDNISSDFKYINSKSFNKQIEHEALIEKDDIEKPLPIVVGEVFKTYIIVQEADDMYLVDKHAAHERLIFERIKSNVHNLDTQMLLEPVIALLSFEEYDSISENLDSILKLGFAVECDVAPSVAVLGTPLILGEINPSDVIAELAQNFIANKINPQLDVFDELYHSLACKAAIKANDNSDISELDVLVKAVFNNPDIRYCPHGRPVMIKLSRKDIEKLFRRIV